MNKRIKAVMMLAVWLFGLLNAFAIPVYGALEEEVLSTENEIIELLVNKMDGRYAIKTVKGYPNREDENEPLLFKKAIPETTFTTFRIDGKDYIFGNTYQGKGLNGSFVTLPVKEGMKNTSKWKIGDIEITQQLELTENDKSSDFGNVKVSYSIFNTGSSSRSIGTRVLLDMMLGSNDGSKVSLDGKTEVTFEKEVSGEAIPIYWRCTDSTADPKVVAYGFVRGWGNTSPDRMTIAHWSALSATKWDYTINPQRNIGSTINDYEKADSAVALYWEPKTLEPNQTMRIETYYGLGNVNESTAGSTFNMNVVSPAKLSIDGDNYKGNPFDIMLELDNSFEKSVELSDITAELVLPEGLTLEEGQEESKYFYRIPVNLKQTAAWRVKAAKTQNLKVLQYMVRLTGMDKELQTIKKFIIVPGFENNDYSIGYTDIVPRNLYYNDENNTIQLIGYGFDKLRDTKSYEISMTNATASYTHHPAEKDITVVNDNQIRISIPKGMETGSYKISINHKNDLLDFALTQEITVTSEEKYRSRSYGILIISGSTARLVESESQITAADKDNAALIIRGKVRQISEGRYDVYGDNITINGTLYYKGYGDRILSVYQSGGGYTVKGNGELYTESAILGSTMDITLKKGYFNIDSATAFIKDEEGYINDISTIYIGYVPILVGDMQIQKNGELKVDGMLKLENKYFNFLVNDAFDTSFMESEVKDMRISSKKIDINAEFTIPFPHWKLGDFQSQYYHLKTQPQYSKTKITFFINTIQGAYGFKSKAQNLKLRLRDINSKMAFDENLIPDYFEFENNYGSIPEPIGNTGLVFESIGGGIYGLKSMIDSLRYGYLPTGSSIKATADIVDLPTYYARIGGKTMIGLLKNEAVLHSGGLDLKGTGNVYMIPVGDFVGHFDLNGGSITANMNILDILIAEAFFNINKNEIAGSIKAKVKVPSKVWFIGGETIGGFNAGLSTSKIQGSVKFLGCGVDIGYKWADNSVDFDVHAPSLGDIFGMEKHGIYTLETKDSNGRDVTVTYGTNIEKLMDIGYSIDVCYNGDSGKILAMGGVPYSYEVPIGSGVESAIIEMRYTSANAPAIEVTCPGGSNYVLEEGVNYRNHIIPASESDSKVEEKRLFVTIPAPSTGEWTIKSDKAVTMALYNAKALATFKALSAKQEADKIKVSWVITEPAGSSATFYLVKEDNASSSVLLGKELNGSLGAYTFDKPLGVTTGSYRVYGEIKRNGIGFDNRYSESFEIVDDLAPSVPVGFSVEAAGNGMLKAEWSGTPDVDEYRIYAVDAEGKPDQDIKVMVSTDGDKKEAVFGGAAKDEAGKVYGWLTGRNYKFALYAVNTETVLESGKEKEIDHISVPAYSTQVYLPLPEPPEFTVGFTADNGNINIEKDENGNEIRYVNTGQLMCSYKSEMNAKVTFYVDGEKITDMQGKTHDLPLNLQPGSHMLEIEAAGANGDKTIKSYEIHYDNSAPELMVQSPGSEASVQAGKVLVSVRTNPSCKLYVNGTKMTVGKDGSFSEELDLSDAQRQTIAIAAVDLAGNKTEYVTEVVNSAASKVERVEIKPQIEELRANENVQLKLYGVTNDNKSVLLGVDEVQWELYDTEGNAVLSEKGLLAGVKPGEVIVHAQYSVSSDTTFEDAAIIKVLSAATNDNNGDNGGDNNGGDNGSKDDEDKKDNKEDHKSPAATQVSTAGSTEGTEAELLIKKALLFKGNDELSIPGALKLKFTGAESLENGFIEILEIKDLLEYRQHSGNKDFVSNIFDINVPEGYSFNSPVELTIHFDKSKIKDLKKVSIYVFNEKTGTWELVGGTVDESNGTITVKCPHFSKYAVMENKEMTLMTDIGGHWAKDEIYRLIDRGIINGIQTAAGEYRFEPERKVTRAEFAKMLSLCEGYQPDGKEEELASFTDYQDIKQWARPYLLFSHKKGWINGKAAGKGVYMKADDNITRAEAAAMISRALGLMATGNSVEAELKDKAAIPVWAAGYVDRLMELKLMLGYADEAFKPDRMLTRAEAAKIFDTYMFIKKSGLAESKQKQ